MNEDTPELLDETRIRLATRLKACTQLSQFQDRITTDYDGQRLLLVGVLPSYYLKQLAQESIRDIARALGFQLINEIRVEPPSGIQSTPLQS